MKWFESKSSKQRRTLWLLFVFFLATVVIQAQDQQIIRGIIKDRSTQLPIEGVNIRLQNTYTGTTTNPQGVFELRVRNLPAVLLVTHIAYFGRQVVVTQKQAESINIFLSPRPIELEETEISDEPYRIFKGKQQEVIDYDFLDTNLLILAYNFNKNRHELILTDEQFDTLSIKDVSYLKKPGQLFKDCMGSCHLLTKDSAYQIYYSDGLLHLIYPATWETFYSTLANCLFETRTHLAFEGKSGQLLKTEYASLTLSDLSNPRDLTSGAAWNHLFFLVDKENHEKTVLDAVNEWEKKRDAYDHAMFVTSGPHAIRHFGDALRFAEMVYFKPAFQTLKLLNDTIYYFNHLKSRIDVYAEDLKLVDTIQINYHERRNWKPLIITDKVKNKVYTIFIVGTKFSLTEIDLRNGSVKEVHKIEKLFPAKIKVHNGYLYFLYRNLNNVWGTRQLFQGELVN